MNRQSVNRLNRWLSILFGAILTLCGNAFAGQLIRVSPELQLYYVDKGRGTPIVFIPGWTGTSEMLQKQVDYFSKSYRTISYDPRSQGRSTKTAENNHYTQHGVDLNDFMTALRLKDVVLVAHSWGCHDVYAYFRVHGTQNVKAFVCIDSNPKAIVEAEGDWGTLKSAVDLKGFHDGISYDRVKTSGDFLQSMVTRPLTDGEKKWFIKQMLQTPTSVTLQLDYDGSMADYSAEAKAIDGKIPVLNILANPGWFDGWTPLGKAWLAKNTPHSEVEELGQHLMFWEFPDKFNAMLESFLKRLR